MEAAATTAAAAPPLVLVVAAAIVRLRPGGGDKKAEVLLGQRPEGKALAGLWEFPGGKVDLGKDRSPEEALARELEEELGLDRRALLEKAAAGGGPARLGPLAFASHAYEKFHLLMPLYAVEIDAALGEPRGLEGQALAWATAEELAGGKYDLPPADFPLVDPVVQALRRLEGR